KRVEPFPELPGHTHGLFPPCWLLPINSTAIMLVAVVPVIVATLAFAWRYRSSNARATRSADEFYEGRVEFVVWSQATSQCNETREARCETPPQRNLRGLKETRMMIKQKRHRVLQVRQSLVSKGKMHFIRFPGGSMIPDDDRSATPSTRNSACCHAH